MKKGDKTITIFYIVLAVALISIFLSFDSLLMHRDVIDILPKPTKELNFERIIPIEREVLFGVITDVSNYPQILPRNVISVNIIEDNGNEIIAEETILEKGVKIKILVKHTIIPYEEHIIEILDGDAKDTKITQKFYEENFSTKLVTKINLELHGLAQGFAYLPKPQLIHAADTVLDAFSIYAKGFDSSSEKIVDSIYREILLRPADKESLDYYAVQLDAGLITEEEIRQKLLDSQERTYILRAMDVKPLSELSIESKNIVQKLYQELLYRTADQEGLRFYATLLDNEILTEEEVRNEIFESNEATAKRIDSGYKRTINDLFIEIFERNATQEELDYFDTWFREKVSEIADEVPIFIDTHDLVELQLEEIILDMKENSLTVFDVME